MKLINQINMIYVNLIFSPIMSLMILNLVITMLKIDFLRNRMTQNAKLSRAGSKDDEYVFSWKLFTGKI